ncbi:MAG: 50S ribosomal protein L10 [Gemmatimonadales bacterium]|nr:50S ribosomal protein L10 [Gemmatimonadota bacterium]MCC7134517.1 50S ribosomal protein L10 [Gemmatimonadales bacterium]MDX2060956.1 50S ribosomal protein L10 [Gemmatimonadales bacterium]
MSKAERQATVDVLTTAVAGSPNIYVTDFAGLNVAKITDLRRRLRAAGARYVVVKNTLAQRALNANQVTTLNDHLAGPTGLVLAGKDPLAAAKVLGQFAKEHQKPSVKIGLVDGKTVDAAYVKRLGELPTRDELLGQFLGCLNGVLYQVVGAMEALKDKRQAESAS